MPETEDWALPEPLQPAADQLQFDLSRALDAMVHISANIPDDAFTASILGTERSGYGAVIRSDGLIVTIGYLITEASSIWITTNRGDVVGGWPVVYDQPTGFGLIQPLGKLGTPWLERGTAANVDVGDGVTVIGHGGRAHAIRTRIVDKREFAGYWEYVLDEALFTSPAHPHWSGAALLDSEGKLIGVGSLLVQEEIDGQPAHANMFVPIDLIETLLDNFLNAERRPARPWLGMYTQEIDDHLVVAGVSPDGPADHAGIQPGDLILGIAGSRIHGLAQFYRAVWKTGPAGVEIPLSIARSGDVLRVSVKTADRNAFLKKPDLH